MKKNTSRQAKVLANLARVTTDGSRHDPMFWLDGDNVSTQVRSLIAKNEIVMHEGRLVPAEKNRKAPVAHDPMSAVEAMRAFCGLPESSISDSPPKMRV